MSKLKNYNLGLFLTHGMSLRAWDNVGILSREIEPYNILADYFNKIYIFTYGDKKELDYQHHLASNIEIIYKKAKLGYKPYSFFLPFFNWNIIKKCHFLKTNQIRGAQSALLSKILNPRARLIVRTGYSWSLFTRNAGKQSKLIEQFEKIIYNYCDAGFVTSKKEKNYLKERYGLKNGKIALLPNYINTELFRPNAKVSKYENRVIFVGRLDKQKNLFNLIRSLGQTHITLDIVGDGPLKEELKKLCGKLNITINFLGTFPNNGLPNILNRYRIFVQPSLFEGLPKALMEAMSCGLACTATDVDGNRELIQDNITGLLSKTDASSLNKPIVRLMNDTQLQNKLGQNGRQFIIDNYSIQSQIKNEIAVYAKLIG